MNIDLCTLLTLAITTKLLLDTLEYKGVIEQSNHEHGDVISNIFIRPRPDGTQRLILNLSKLNDHIEQVHFKMETLNSALKFSKPRDIFCKS